MESLTKVCSHCEQEKPIQDYASWIDSKSGKKRTKPYCRSCGSKLVTDWKKRNRNRTREIERRYERKNKESLKKRRSARKTVQLMKLGGRCERCGETDLNLLSQVSKSTYRLLCQNCRKVVS